MNQTSESKTQHLQALKPATTFTHLSRVPVFVLRVFRFLPRLCRKLPTLRRFYLALRAGQRSELPVDGDGLCWAYGMNTCWGSVVLVFNRSATPVTRRIGVGALGLSEGMLNELIGNTQKVVAGGVVDVFLAGGDVRIFMDSPKRRTRRLALIP